MTDGSVSKIINKTKDLTFYVANMLQVQEGVEINHSFASGFTYYECIFDTYTPP